MTYKDPNLSLIRTRMTAQYTLGNLYDNNHSLLALTLEPAYRSIDERQVMGQTAIPLGRYPLTLEFDPNLQYKCLRLGKVRGFKNVRLCYPDISRAFSHQSKGNILLGSSWNEQDECLEGCLLAFNRLMRYYESIRCNHGQLRLEIINQ